MKTFKKFCFLEAQDDLKIPGEHGGHKEIISRIIRKILIQIKDNPNNPNPYEEAMDMVLAGDRSPDLEIIVRSSAINENHNVLHAFVNFMGHADDKIFKKYSNLLNSKVRDYFKYHPRAQLKLKKFERTKAQIQADKKYDTFVFVGVDKFKKMLDGKYERELDIESLVKIDKYDHDDLNAVTMMRLRAHTREGGHIYIIKLPRGVIKEKVTHNIEPWLINLIDEHKEKI